MNDFETGVVFGKFWPLHLGHLELLGQAARQCRNVHVFVNDGREDVPVSERMRWVAEACPEATAHSSPDLCGHESEHCTPKCSEAYAAVVHDQGLFPDVVFSGEPYGDVLARCLGATSARVDRQRIECRGREIRADIAGRWTLIAPPARAYYCRKVVVVGAESTGTTTLAIDLAARFGTAWVPEYGRTFTEEHGLDHEWVSEDFVLIAERQSADIASAARGEHPMVVCDTDALATAIWHERYVGSPAPASVWELAAATRPALYLLTGDEIPFVQDGMRDGEHVRGWMTSRFREVLAASEVPYLEVSGSAEERVRMAVAAIVDNGLEPVTSAASGPGGKP